MKTDLMIFLGTHPLSEEFLNQVKDKTFCDIREYVTEFSVFCNSVSIPSNFDNELWFKILNEKITRYVSESNLESFQLGEDDEKHPITFGIYNPNLYLDETDLEEFIKEWEAKSTGKRKFTDEQSKRYKSYRESWLYDEYTCTEDFLERYKYAVHPLVQTTIGRALINNGDLRGVGYVFNALTRAVIMPNIYWNNPQALRGYVESIWEVLRLCRLAHITGQEEGIKDDNLTYKLVKLIFLYMSRCIELTPEDIRTADVYSNRAELFYFFHDIMMTLFANYGFFAIIPDLQFSSDKYLAYETAARTCPELISCFYEQCLWDSKKMYQYGNLNYPIIDGGYTVIEDEGWMDIVKRGKFRSRIVAQKIYDEDITGNVYMTKKQVEYLFGHIISSDIDIRKNLKDVDNK